MLSSDESRGRRAALSLVGSSLLALLVTACAGAAGGEPTYRGGRRRRRDGDVPFWHREEQRDD